MTAGNRDAASGPFVVTLVVDLPITKLDALDVIAFVSDAGIDDAGTAHPRVALGEDAWAEVQIPKFADPPPLAVDVCSGVSPAVARGAAALLAERLIAVGWTVRSPHPGEA